MAGGLLDVARADAIVEAVTSLDDAGAVAVQDRILPGAPTQTRVQLRASLARAVLAHDPAAAQRRHEQALARRTVVLTPVANGMAEFWALLPADHASALYTALTPLAERAKAPGDPRGIDQRRADALGDLATTVLDHHELPRRHRRRPHLHLTLAATTALGLDEAPGELAGYGPIPASVARRIADDATWRRILTDPTSGTLLDYGTTTYHPPRALTDHVITRDLTCQGPGCRQPASRCDLDHRIPYPAGPTAAHNLHPLCRRHHQAKTEAGWSYATDPRGTLTWTSPTGHTTIRPPHPQLGEPPPALGQPPPAHRGEPRPPPEQPGQSPPRHEQPARRLDDGKHRAHRDPGDLAHQHVEQFALPPPASADDDVPPY